MDDAPCDGESASLDPLETNEHPLQLQSGGQRRIHAWAEGVRTTIIEALHFCEDHELQKRATRMADCCRCPLIHIQPGRTPVVAAGRCRDRLCPTCCRTRAREVKHRVEGLLERSDQVRMMTLTRPRSSDSLGACVDFVLASFRELRRTTVWKQHVKSGVGVIEITRGSEGTHWHVHLHVLYDGRYFPHDQLKTAWSRLMGQPAIVHLNAVHGRKRAAVYVAKYLSKGSDLAAWSNEEIREYARGIHRRRLLLTFGRWHKVIIDPKKADDEKKGLPCHTVSTARIELAMQDGRLSSEKALPLLRRLSWCLRAMWTPTLPWSPIDDTPPTELEAVEITEMLMRLLDDAEEKPPDASSVGRNTPDGVNGQLFEKYHP